MERTYPQETLGTTLVEQDLGSEWRRVYLVERERRTEVGELSKGDITQATYGAPVHLHCVHLYEPAAVEFARAFFAQGDLYLADLMDALDERDLPYGYLNNEPGKFVSYRPARAKCDGEG